MADGKHPDSGTLENPTLVLKLSAILSEPWNNELRTELVSNETIAKLRGTPIQVVSPTDETQSDWSNAQVLRSFEMNLDQ